MTHTKGPWRAEPNDSCPDPIWYVDTPDGSILMAASKADATLMAAAPELLEALDMMLEWGLYPDDEDLDRVLPAQVAAVRMARAALLKAKGGA